MINKISLLLLSIMIILPSLLFSQSSGAQDQYNKQLHKAALSGNLEELKDALKKGAQINSPNTYDIPWFQTWYTPLYEACEKGHFEAAKYLLDKGAGFRFYGKSYLSCLFGAVNSKKIEMIKLLFDYGMTLSDDKGNDDSKCVLQVDGPDSENIIFYLLSKGVSIETYGNELITRSVRAGYSKLLDFLLKKGVPLESKDEDGNTLLMLACSFRNFDVAKYLLKQGADIDALNDRKQTALSIACYSTKLDIMEFLLENGADTEKQIGSKNFAETAICEVTKLDALKLMIKYKADIHKKNTLGQSLLWNFIFDMDGFNFLVKNGFDVNDVNDNGETVLFEAALSGRIEVVKYLIQKKIKVNARNYAARTALFQACEKGETEIAEILIANGAEVKIQDRDGISPLMTASFRGSPQQVELLLKKGADPQKINKRPMDFMGKKLTDKTDFKNMLRLSKDLYAWAANIDDYNVNALTYSIIGKKPENTELLLKNNADANYAIQNVSPVLHLAAALGYTEIVQLLLKYGADPLKKDAFGMTAFDWAVEMNKDETAGVLKG
ncbi:MAG: ankyrin repeat domain-containing protein [Spirochaetales bacterium]|nr:ankyrin repeat domain-containing protein [Spirochaetales bacterium]